MKNQEVVLTRSEIDENHVRFVKIFTDNVKRPGADRFLKWLETTDFFTAPASTRFHEAYAGGLCEHSLAVYDKLVALQSAKLVSPVWDKEQTALLALTHDVCKVRFYKESSRNVKNEQTGQWEKVPCYTVEDMFPYGHGEKSVFLIGRFIWLSDIEALAIRWHMGAHDESVKGGSYAEGNAYDMHPEILSLHIADMLACHFKNQKSVFD